MPDQVFGAMSPAEIVGLTLIGEARGEPIEGIIAVGNVIKNRLKGNGTYRSYQEVCLAANQFSCWNDTDPNKQLLLELAIKMIHGNPVTDLYLVQCIFVASGIIDNKLADNVKGAEFYMVSSLLNSSSAPSWSKNRKNELVKGNHTFFSLI